MSSDGVILQHRTKLIAHLFVDRSDNLLIGNPYKNVSPRRPAIAIGKTTATY
jgi:hypothetical protein